MSAGLKNGDRDLIQRVLADVQTAFSRANDERDAQRIHDLKKEIDKRQVEIESLRSSLEDSEDAAALMVDVSPMFAVVCLYRADGLREGIKKLDPASLIHKVEELERRERWGKLLSKAVELVADEVAK